MSVRAIIRPATLEAREALVHQRIAALHELPQTHDERNRFNEWLNLEHEERLHEYMQDHCLLLAQLGNNVVGSAALDLDQPGITGLCVLPEWRGHGIGKRLLTSIERLAASYGIDRISTQATLTALAFFQQAGYEPSPGGQLPTAQHGMGIETLSLERSLSRRQTVYGRRIRDLLIELGMPSDYGRSHRLVLQPESTQLANIGQDFAGREQFLRPDAAMAWYAMRNEAVTDDIELEVVSAFRSVDYQAGIVQRKQAQGQSIDAILRVSAAPGYSEHHTGCALDLNCPGHPPLEDSFEASMAFEWLVDHAHEHGFRMSFPRNNRHGIAFEPWHWFWAG
jgi:D-alanyl-D-alanine carboxypeptidase